MPLLCADCEPGAVKRIEDAVKRGGESTRTAVPAFASASRAAGVWEGLGLQYTKRACSERLYRVRCRRLPSLGLMFNAGQGADGRKLNSSGGGSAAPHGQDGGAQGFLVRVDGWLQRLAASGSSGERRSEVSDYFVIT